MNVDLPPPSGFVPDPTVAQTRTVRDTSTLTLAPEHGQGLDRPAGTVTGSSQLATGRSTSASYRVAIAVDKELALTITF